MKSVVRWAVNNSPAMNTLMIGVLVVGALSMWSMHREVFPQFELEILLVTVPYPGASPEEVEEGLSLKMEEAVRSIDGIKRLTSIAQEGTAFLVLELETYVDVQQTLNEVRSEIDRIPSLPDLAEDPEIQQITFREPAIRVGVIGPAETDLDAELALRDVTEGVRNDLLALPSISQANIVGGRPYQIDVQISESRLREYGLSLAQVANIIRRQNIELPGGSIKSDTQEILLRGKNKKLLGEEIARIPLVTEEDGVVLTVEDLGTVTDAFEDVTAINRIDGQPGLAISVDRTRNEDLLGIVDEVKEYVARAQLPAGYHLKTWADHSVDVRDRMNLLLKNGIQGLILVFLVLAIFLDLRLSFWVALGIPIAILGAGAALLYFGQTLNMLSMFAFLMALGIVVDDAIVIGENIYAHKQRGGDPITAAINGTVEVIPSVFASVTTTIIAFTPLLFVSGVMGKFIAVMPVAVIAMLVISLIESTFILPCHLAHSKSAEETAHVTWARDVWTFFRSKPALVKYSLGIVLALLAVVAEKLFYPFHRLSEAFHWISYKSNRFLEAVVDRFYLPTLRWSLKHPSIVISTTISGALMSLGLVAAGVTPFTVFPESDSNEIEALLLYPDGTPASITDAATQRIAAALERVNEQLSADRDTPMVRTIRRTVGQARDLAAIGPDLANGSHVGKIDGELVDAGTRNLTSQEVVAMWRKEAGEFPGVESLTFGSPEQGPGGTPIEFRLLTEPEHMSRLEEAIEKCKKKLATYKGIVDIRDDSRPGKWEFQLKIKEKAESLGITLAQLAQTVRGAYYGEEVMRLQRGRHEVKLMVRYPEDERRELANFNEIRVRDEDGTEYPLTELAEVTVQRGYAEINRIDQLRSIAVLADVRETEGNARETVANLQAKFMPGLLAEYPELTVAWEGQQEQTNESVASMIRGLIVALLAMFVLLTLEFRSYFQPLIILGIIPFGVVGAIWGHAFMGLELTMFTLFGLVALTGVVVNDSIVLIDSTLR